jgi:hypothetical protein
MGGMTIPRRLFFARRRQLFQGKLSDRQKKAETGSVIRLGRIHLSQDTVSNQAKQLLQKPLLRWLLRRSCGSCGRDRARIHRRKFSRKDSQPVKKQPLFWLEQVIAPLNSPPQRPLPFCQMTILTGQQI